MQAAALVGLGYDSFLSVLEFLRRNTVSILENVIKCNLKTVKMRIRIISKHEI
jgi:hypothetical protein